MLSPLKSSAPSASLLRFLHLQSGFASQSTPVTRCHGTSATGPSRRSSAWVRQDKSYRTATLHVDSLTPSDARPALSSSPKTFVRHTSTARRPLLRRLFDLRRSKAAECNSGRSQKLGLADDGTEGIFNIGRGLAAKASNELRIRCTEFDNNGNVTLMNGEFRKLELIAKVGYS